MVVSAPLPLTVMDWKLLETIVMVSGGAIVIAVFLLRHLRWPFILVTDDQLQRFAAVATKIRFERSRQCTDGICCFMNIYDEVPRARQTCDFFLWFFPIDAEIIYAHNANTWAEVLPQLRLQFGYMPRLIGRACQHLKLDYQLDANATLAFYCADYANRPRACQLYPKPVSRLSSELSACTYNKFCRSPAAQIALAGDAWFFFIAVNAQRFPLLEKFSVGSLRYTGFRRYFILPCPHDPAYRETGIPQFRTHQQQSRVATWFNWC